MISQRVCVCALICLFSGCGGSKLYPVEGVVVFKNGTPLNGGVVMFELLGDGPAKTVVRGDIQKDGTFRLGTSKPGDGAAPGRYRAWITPPLPGGREGALQSAAMDPRFADPQRSGLEFTIEPRKNTIRIEVE